MSKNVEILQREEDMAICRLTICTRVDERENKIVRMGKIEEKEGEVLLRYREEDAEICLFLKGKSAEIHREGDYSLFLPLIVGERSEGRLGFGGTQGRVEIHTCAVEYSFADNGGTLFLDYDLLFGDEAQKMQLEILVGA